MTNQNVEMNFTENVFLEIRYFNILHYHFDFWYL